MLLQFENPNLKRMDMSGLSLLEKLRWSLNERLCEQMRLLNSNFFDEVDDFLFTGGQNGQFIQDSVCLKSMREIRAKQELFEETFLSAVSARLQNIVTDDNGSDSRQQGKSTVAGEDAVYEKVEIDLALKTMQRKALKFYLPLIKRLENLSQKQDSQHDLSFLQKELLIANSVKAFSVSQGVFNLTLEARLILLKLFERHFLMKMEKLFLDTISIINNSSDEAFIEKLYSSSASFNSRQTIRGGDPVQEHRIDLARNAIMKSEDIEQRISLVIDDLCRAADLPTYVTAMIDKRWRAIMFVIGLNNGVDSNEFIQATDSLSNLICLVTDPDYDEVSPARIKQALSKGFQLVQCPAAEQGLFFQQLEEDLGGRAGNGTDFSVGRSNAEQTSSQTKSVNTTNYVKGSSITEAAVSPFADTALNSDDLNELAGLLDDQDHASEDTFTDDDDSMTQYLVLVDEISEGIEALYTTCTETQKCQIYRSTKVDNHYQIKDRLGRVILTRSRLGLAVSLREGELQLSAKSGSAAAVDSLALNPAIRQITLIESVTEIRKP